jgi:hypothetical protein
LTVAKKQFMLKLLAAKYKNGELAGEKKFNADRVTKDYSPPPTFCAC